MYGLRGICSCLVVPAPRPCPGWFHLLSSLLLALTMCKSSYSSRYTESWGSGPGCSIKICCSLKWYKMLPYAFSFSPHVHLFRSPGQEFPPPRAHEAPESHRSPTQWRLRPSALPGTAALTDFRPLDTWCPPHPDCFALRPLPAPRGRWRSRALVHEAQKQCAASGSRAVSPQACRSCKHRKEGGGAGVLPGGPFLGYRTPWGRHPWGKVKSGL